MVGINFSSFTIPSCSNRFKTSLKSLNLQKKRFKVKHLHLVVFRLNN